MRIKKHIINIMLIWVFSIATYAQLITFEPGANGVLPDGSAAQDDMVISNQFLHFGVVFGYDNDMDGTMDSNGHPVLEEIGFDGDDGFITSGSGEWDSALDETNAVQLGQFFLRTSPVTPTSSPDTLLVSYIQPVEKASGEIWDIDGSTYDYEQWRIEALNAEGKIITNVTSPAGIYYEYSNSLNGLPWSFQITADDLDRISALRFVYCGTRPEYIGLAFNNFSPAEGLGTTNIIGVAKICPSVEIYWQTKLGKSYQLQWSQGLGGEWHNLGALVIGTGVEVSVFDSSRGAINSRRMYRVLEMD